MRFQTAAEEALFFYACKLLKNYKDCTPDVGPGPFRFSLVMDVARAIGKPISWAEANKLARQIWPESKEE